MASAGPPAGARGPLLTLSSATGAGVTEALRAVGAAIDASRAEEGALAAPAEWRP
jgi:GTP-binding protein